MKISIARARDTAKRETVDKQPITITMDWLEAQNERKEQLERRQRNKLKRIFK